MAAGKDRIPEKTDLREKMMKERSGKNTLNEYFEFGRQCTYCRAQRSQEYELCKYCGVYRQGMDYMAELWPGNRKPSTGESLARFDFSSKEMIKLYCQAGMDRKQIESQMEKLIRDNIRLMVTDK